MAVYEKEQKLQESVPVDRFSLKEQHLYGSSRLGMRQTDLTLAVTGEDITMPQQGRTLGEKYFELTNHLGNVLAVVTDNKYRQGNTYKASVVSATDYYPFGMIMPGRSSNLYLLGNKYIIKEKALKMILISCFYCFYLF